MKHYRLAKLLFAEIALIVIVSASVVLTYTWLLPRYFNGARTPIPLLFGIVVVMLLGALLTSGGSGDGKRWRSWVICVRTGLTAGVLTFLIVLAALVRVFGS